MAQPIGSIGDTLSQARVQADSPMRVSTPPRSQTSMALRTPPTIGSPMSTTLMSPSSGRGSPVPMSFRVPQGSPGTMTVASPSALKDLVSSLPRTRFKRSESAAGKESHGKKAGLADKAKARIAEKRRLLAVEDAKLQGRLKQEIRERMIEDTRRNREAEARRLKAIEDEQAGFVKQVEGFLKRKEQADTLARKDLLNLWNEQVYKKIESKIAKQVEAVDKKELADRLNSLLDDYVDTVNTKTVFRDIIIESEYDPFRAKKDIIKVNAQKRSKDCQDGIVDPLLEQIEKVMEIHEGREHLLKGGGRATDLPVRDWDKVEATPHGFAARIFDESMKEKDPLVEAQRGRVRRNKSDGVDGQLDHYTYARGTEGARLARNEAPAGKKCFPGWAPKGVTTKLSDWKPPFALDADKAPGKASDPYAT